MTEHKIIYTEVDEAPYLATYSLLPIFQAFTKGTGITLDQWDISLSGRILANFPDQLTEEQKIPDYLSKLGELALTKEANIIKLPNISASIPQLKAAIQELQDQGYKVPDYPDSPQSDEEKKIKERYAVILGSAVNPVLRQGNSDRRAPEAVKAHAKKAPKSMGLPLKEWSSDSKSHVSHMSGGDFYETEKSTTMDKNGAVKIEFVDDQGQTTVLKERVDLLEGEVIDAAAMSVSALRRFFADEIVDAKEKDILLSLHMKATMMKVSDPVIFGHCVSVYYKDALEKHSETIQELGFNPNNGIGDLYKRMEKLPEEKRKEIDGDIQKLYENGPKLAMVDSSKGITNLHVPSDVIIDASMPVVVRDGGKMWGPDDRQHDCKAMIPDRSYATMYAEIVEDCRKNGAFDRSVMGTVPNVGLMAMKAEEYGSHDKTFEAPGTGAIRVVDESGNALLEQQVNTGDLFRMCQVKDEAIRDWVKLAVTRARATGAPAVFWLDEQRGHDRELINKVNTYLKDHNTDGLELHIKAPIDAMKFSLERIRRGEDTISVTGNVLRDYLTDLFPILELGTSAKMLSVVPLLNGGGLFETGAGGSAPKHVQQFLKENHLRWDSLGEYSAMVVSFEHIGKNFNNAKALVLSKTLNQAIEKFLENQKSPSRKVNEPDNRASNYYLGLYWAQALAAQDDDSELKERFTKIAQDLGAAEEQIVKELVDCQGDATDIGGYYRPDKDKVSKAMCPSETLNKLLAEIG